jgi:hypothetical protein
MTDEFPVTSLEAPWGTYENLDTYLAFMSQLCDQLRYLLERNQSPNPEYTKIDLLAYEEVLATGNEYLAELFLKIKDDARRQGKRYKDNRAVIDAIKQSGEWAKAISDLPAKKKRQRKLQLD